MSVSSVESAIKFRHLISTLSEEELIQFHLQLMHKCGKEIFINSFCHQYLNVKSTHNNEKNLNQAIETVTNLIKSRQKNESTNSDLATVIIKQFPKYGCLDLLPMATIGSIASYCQQRDYFSFLASNRSIYLACNASNTLRKINIQNKKPLDYHGYYAQMNILKYTHITTLGIPVDHEFLPKNIHFHFPRLKRLFLYRHSHFHETLSQVFRIINSLLTSPDSIINSNKIQHLSLHEFGACKSVPFFDMLRKCPNLEYLDLHNTTIIDINSSFGGTIRKIISSLKGFGIFGQSNQVTNALIRHYGNDINYLGASNCQSYNYNLHNTIIIPGAINFSNLKELCLSRIQADVFENILNKARNIESITLQKNLGTIWNSISLIFKTQHHLKSLTIIENHYGEWNSIMNCIHDAVYHTNHYVSTKSDNKHKYEQMRIALLFWPSNTKLNNNNISCLGKPRLRELFRKLTMITNELAFFSFATHFVLKIEHIGKFDGNLINECSLFKDKYLTQAIQLTSAHTAQDKDCCQNVDLIINNKDNSMNGWSDGSRETVLF